MTVSQKQLEFQHKVAGIRLAIARVTDEFLETEEDTTALILALGETLTSYLSKATYRAGMRLKK